MGLFGPDKMTLTLEKYDFRPGDRIIGTVSVNLKKPMKARNLLVAFIGRVTERTTSSTVRVGSSSHTRHGASSNTQTFDIYNFQMPLDGEKEYLEGVYPFDIKIPENIFQTNQQPASPQLEGMIGTLDKIMASTNPIHSHSRIDWFVESHLDIPLGLDVRKSQKVVLSP